MFVRYMSTSRKNKRILGLLMSCIISVGMDAQLNFLVGYDLGYYPNFNANEVFEGHNQQNQWYKTPLENIGVQHGLQLGLRYAFDYFGVTATYKNTGLNTEAEGIPPGTTQSFRREISFQNNVFGLGLESHFKVFNYGASLDYQRVKIRGETSDLNNSYIIQEENIWNLRVYVQIEFTGDRYIGFAMQPYYSLPLQSFALDPLSDELGVSGDVDWKQAIIGCSFLMTNGPR